MSSMPLPEYNTPDCWVAILQAYANEVALSDFERNFVRERLKVMTPGIRVEEAAQMLTRVRWSMPQTKIIAEMFSKARRLAEEDENSEDVGADTNCAKICEAILGDPGHSPSFYAEALGMRRDTLYRTLCGFLYFNTNKHVLASVAGMPTNWTEIRKEFIDFFRRHKDAPEAKNYITSAHPSPPAQDAAAAAATDAEVPSAVDAELAKLNVMRTKVLARLEAAITSNAAPQEIQALALAYASLV